MNKSEHYQDKTISNWQGSSSSHVKLIEIRSIDDIKSSLSYAKEFGLSIAIKGGGCSYSDVFLNNDGIVLDLTNFNKILSFDKANLIIEVESGATLDRLLDLLLPQGFTLPIVPGVRFPCVGGVLGNNVHGKNCFKEGNFGDCIENMTVLTANNNEVECSRDTNSDLFHGVIGGAGLLGVVTKVKLRVKKPVSASLKVEKFTVPNLKEMLQSLIELSKNNEFVIGQVDLFAPESSMGRGTIHAANFSSEKSDLKNVEPTKISPYMFGIIPKSLVVWWGRRFMCNTTMSLVSKLKYFLDNRKPVTHIQNYCDFNFLMDQLPGWPSMYKHGFVEHESLIPFDKAEKIFRKMLKYLSAKNLPPHLGAIKVHRSDDYLMSFALDGFSFGFDIPLSEKNASKLSEAMKELNQITLEEEGLVYFAKDQFLTTSQTKLMYRNFDKFLTLKNKWDANELFQSNTYRRIFKNQSYIQKSPSGLTYS